LELTLNQESQGNELPGTATNASPAAKKDEVREIRPFFFLGGKDDTSLDFRSRPEPVDSSSVVEEKEDQDAPDPKDLFAPESANSSPFTETSETEDVNESPASQVQTVSAEKDNGKLKENAQDGTPAS
jgi:hypothetical protein